MNLLSRLKRTAFSWIGATPTAERKLTPSQNSNHPETSTNQRSRVQLIWEARDLQRNHPLVAGILKRLSLYTVGTIRFQARTSDPAFNAAAEAYFQKWSRNADIAGRFDFVHLVQLAFISFLRDGDAVIVHSITTDGLKLQLVEADRVGNPYASIVAENEIGGICFDDLGRPETFRIYRRTMGAAYTDPQEIPAARCLHLFDPERHDSYRGISALAPVIATCRDIVDILEGEKAAVKWAAGQSGLIKTQSGNGQGWDETTATGERIERIKPGTIHYLKPGEEVQSFRNERPSVTFTGFLETLQRHISDALGLPYGFFVDSSKLGGVTARLDSQQAARVCRRYQDLLTRQILDPIAQAVVALGIAEGQIPENPNWNAHRWQFPPWPSADIGRETKAALEEIAAGGGTWSEYYAEKGEDWEEAFSQSAIETARRKAIFSEAGVADPVLAAAAMKPGAGAPPPAAFEAKPESFEPPKGVQEAAARALRNREQQPPSKRGMTPVGIARARDLANGRRVSVETLKRMKAYFDRHEVDKKGSTWNAYGKGRQAWDGWGGDAGRAWATRVLASLEK
jgi:lambda family phage portal protein